MDRISEPLPKGHEQQRVANREGLKNITLIGARTFNSIIGNVVERLQGISIVTANVENI